MITIKESTAQNGSKAFELDGVIDEAVDFPASPLAKTEKEMHVDLFGIKRINSTGIKKWITFFTDLQKKEIKVHYHRVSPAMVEQMNMIANFNCGGEVQSVVFPFKCKACKKPSAFIQGKQEVAAIDLENVDWPCQSCGAKELEFDDIADEYTRFWNK